MRCSHFSILAVLFLTATTALAQNLTVAVAPHINPIEIPPEGGSFSYQVSVTNHESGPQQATLWCLVTTPSGNQRVALLPITASIAEYATIRRTYTLTLPSTAPLGNYTLTAKIGIYPEIIWASDQFTFCKLKPAEWAARYNGPGNNDDWAFSLAVDGSGNVYVTGYSIGSVNNPDYATIKYNSAGAQQWVARYNGAGGGDHAFSLAVDGSGNVYVTGGSVGIGTSSDYATIKYNSAGVQEWVARYNGPGNYIDSAIKLTVDDSGNVYVTGSSDGSGTDKDYATIKYNSAGVQQWVARYNGSGNNYDEASSLAVDGSGNVYVTGWSSRSGNSYDYTTIKYNSAGVQEWVAFYNWISGSGDYATSLAVDGSGNVFVTGFSGNTSDYATIKYNSSGVQEWVARYNGPGNSNDQAYSLAVDGSGNVYITGNSIGSGTNWDYATIKYNSAGVLEWVARYSGPGNNYDETRSLAVDGSGNVYVTGGSCMSEANCDYTTIQYNSAGVQEWVARYNGGSFSNYTRSLAVDGSGNVYVTGKSIGGGGNSDYATVKYSATDLPDWQPPVATAFGAPLPKEYCLEQNYPNPFNPTTTIRYQLPADSHIKLEVFDVSGRLVTTLINGWREAGSHEVTFDAAGLVSGVYLYKLEASGSGTTPTMLSGKMVLLK